MEALLDQLDSTPATGAVVALQSISGMAGVGKSLLAWHAAELLEHRFPDGLLHLDLRTHAPSHDPVTPRAALVHLLRLLGLQPRTLPDSEDDLVSLWRSTMATRRAVIVLDDAAGSAQIRPLLPGSSPSLVLITSRRRMTGLAGVRTLNLGLLPESDAITLFRRTVDDDRADDDLKVAKSSSCAATFRSRWSSRPAASTAGPPGVWRI